MTITEFLEARITEDESDAQAASPGPWKWDGEAAEDEAFLYGPNDDAVLFAYGMHSQGFLECSGEDRAHIARNNPTRVLAECAAKRAIIESFQNIGTAVGKANDLPNQLVLEGMQTGMRMAIVALTFPYKDHPDYQQEWAA